MSGLSFGNKNILGLERTSYDFPFLSYPGYGNPDKYTDENSTISLVEISIFYSWSNR